MQKNDRQAGVVWATGWLYEENENHSGYAFMQETKLTLSARGGY